MALPLGKLTIIVGAGHCFLSFSPFRFSPIFYSNFLQSISFTTCELQFLFLFFIFLILSRDQYVFRGYIVSWKK